MHDDPFATLGPPRRLDLDDDTIEAAWRELGRQLHPDSQRGDAERAAEVNRAHQILHSPAQRLRHWLALHSVEIPRQAAIDPALMDLFGEISTVLATADEVLQRRAAAGSALARALLAEPEIAAQQQIQAALGRLNRQRAAAVATFPDVEKDADHSAAVALHGRLGFLEKWEQQVQQRLISLIADY